MTTITEFDQHMRELNPSKDYAEQYRQPFAGESLPLNFQHGIHLDGLAQTKIFHTLVGLRVTTDWSATPPVSERILRATLLTEEVFETLFKGLGVSLAIATSDGKVINIGPGDLESGAVSFHVFHREGHCYDPIETADGLADVKVICNGTAVSFGIPQTAVDCEVWASNMTKLDKNGNPIVNRCQYDGRLTSPCNEEPCILDEGGDERMGPCSNSTHFIDATKPRGKVLEPESYVPANIARVYRQAVAPYLDVEEGD